MEIQDRFHISHYERLHQMKFVTLLYGSCLLSTNPVPDMVLKVYIAVLFTSLGVFLLSVLG